MLIVPLKYELRRCRPEGEGAGTVDVDRAAADEGAVEGGGSRAGRLDVQSVPAPLGR